MEHEKWELTTSRVIPSSSQYVERLRHGGSLQGGASSSLPVSSSGGRRKRPQRAKVCAHVQIQFSLAALSSVVKATEYFHPTPPKPCRSSIESNRPLLSPLHPSAVADQTHFQSQGRNTTSSVLQSAAGSGFYIKTTCFNATLQVKNRKAFILHPHIAHTKNWATVDFIHCNFNLINMFMLNEWVDMRNTQYLCRNRVLQSDGLHLSGVYHPLAPS